MTVTRALNVALRFVPDRTFRTIRSINQEALRLFKPQWFREPLETAAFFDKAFGALSFNNIAGDYLEFGCHSGSTFTMAYEASRRYDYRCKLWAFDSFGGLPESKQPEDEHPRWVKGSMSTSLAEFEAIMHRRRIPKAGYRTVPGLFEQTLAPSYPLAAELPRRVCMAYIDCDLYSSSKTVLEFLERRLNHGMIIAFDDYFCYSPTQVSGERRACTEMFHRHPKWRLVPYIQYGYFAQSFMVEARDGLPDEAKLSSGI